MKNFNGITRSNSFTYLFFELHINEGLFTLAPSINSKPAPTALILSGYPVQGSGLEVV